MILFLKQYNPNLIDTYQLIFKKFYEKNNQF